MKRNLCALGSRNMGSEKGRGLEMGEHGYAALWVERLVWPLPHLYAVGSYSGALMTVVGNVRHRHRMELGNDLRRSRAPELHTAAPGEMTQGLAHCRGMSSAEQEARKGDKRKLQPEPSLVYIIRNTHVNTPNTHACHTHRQRN